MKLKRALLAGVALALPAAAQAQPLSGLYLGAGVGVNWQMDGDVTLDSTLAGFGGARTGSSSFKPDLTALISLGYGYGNGLRTEFELSVRHHNPDSLTGFGTGASTTTGNAFTYGFMVNALYDFDLGLPVMPYAGLGLGALLHNYRGLTQNALGGPNFVRIDDADWTLGYQAILGAALPLHDVAPGLSLTAEYRFLGGLPVDLAAGRRFGGAGGRGSVEVESIYNHSVVVGFRYSFAPPSPPPPVVAPAPAAAPAPARTFLVFFDFDRADLTDRARQIIAEAATNAQRVGTTRIEVAGHADRSGTPQYNQRLSERRANAVAAELERRGVARSAMVIQAFGESRPLVPTADGVREPQNRRVEIVLR